MAGAVSAVPLPEVPPPVDGSVGAEVREVYSRFRSLMDSPTSSSKVCRLFPLSTMAWMRAALPVVMP